MGNGGPLPPSRRRYRRRRDPSSAESSGTVSVVSGDLRNPVGSSDRRECRVTGSEGKVLPSKNSSRVVEVPTHRPTVPVDFGVLFPPRRKTSQ